MNILVEFFTTFINSYYTNDKAVANDRELQAWLKETVPGKVHDFPKQIQTKADIIGILTHQAYLNSIVRMCYSSYLFSSPKRSPVCFPLKTIL